MRRSARRTQLVAAIAIVLPLAAVVSVGLWAGGVAGTATAGKAQAQAGARSLASMDATAAISQFAAASSAFASAERSLGADWVVGAAKTLPWVWRQYSATRTLVGLGSEGSVAGGQLAEALQRASAASSTADPAGRLAAVLAGGRKEVENALATLLDVADRASALSADGLAPPIARAVDSLQTTLRQAAPFLSRGRALLPLITYLLMGEHRILVVSQNGAELRPTGGFAGSFGIVEVGSAGVRLDEYKDVYTLPDPPGRVAPPPGALMTRDFSFRDANWWIDFPTSARVMLGFWSDYGQPPVDGLIAIDTVTMKELLAATGPVFVPSVNETFTADNLLSRLLYIVEVSSGGGRNRKDVLAALAERLERRILAASPGDLAKSARALGKAADAKHVQMYFPDPAAQAAADALGWSGRVAFPAGTTDLLAITNAMTQPGKVNFAMRKTIDYEIGLRTDCSADTTLVLGYANTGPYLQQLPPVFRDWLRVYRSPTTVFPSAAPDGRKTVKMVEFGFPAEVRTFSLLRGQSRVETLIARVPDATRADATRTVSPAAAHYRLRVIRQADLEDIPTTVTLTVPEGWRVTGASARYTASGRPVVVTIEPGRARMEVPLQGDLELDVRLVTS